ncbi:MAG: S9 family peptidase, partial [Lutibacter sp.]|nr:S9 family peptidase [Lutibacter sp.]
EKGQFPFIDQLNLQDKKKKRIYQSEYTDKVENLQNFDAKKSELLVRIESPKEYPNYYFRDLRQDKLNQITFFKNPFTSIQNVHKEVINYQREDGLALSAT